MLLHSSGVRRLWAALLPTRNKIGAPQGAARRGRRAPTGNLRQHPTLATQPSVGVWRRHPTLPLRPSAITRPEPTQRWTHPARSRS